ncbi:uncharacterized protein G2W53_005419 [Senna tora]|uniref:Uncharacterized protein n=1 Tax=Senna tora TaxID=362788 RepID=A0A834X3H3_9FABA|nr:uncharacterized protein G2W53_005419 [Senna tora]
MGSNGPDEAEGSGGSMK